MDAEFMKERIIAMLEEASPRQLDIILRFIRRFLFG